MDLFSNETIENLLPYDGTVLYYGHALGVDACEKYTEALLQTVDWRFDEAVIFGKLIQTKRKVAWYGDAPFTYTYSNVQKTALAWTPELLELKKLVELKTGETYNSCLLNLYPSGNEGMGWHADGEKMLKKEGAIASLSLGATRMFAFKHRDTQAVVKMVLEPGSLLVMRGKTQAHWLHRLPPTKKVLGLRINLTFRTVVL